MRIQINDDNYVIQWSLDDQFNELLFDIPETVEIPEDFEENAFFYKYEDGEFIFDSEYKEETLHEQKVVEIRQHREQTCFPIINRGGLWYDLLSENERAELLDWYMAWLDATETLIEPEMPEWLKEMI